jgi:hypothetical protein
MPVRSVILTRSSSTAFSTACRLIFFLMHSLSKKFFFALRTSSVTCSSPAFSWPPAVK